MIPTILIEKRGKILPNFAQFWEAMGPSYLYIPPVMIVTREEGQQP